MECQAGDKTLRQGRMLPPAWDPGRPPARALTRKGDTYREGSTPRHV
jgi:hypothetical protein